MPINVPPNPRRPREEEQLHRRTIMVDVRASRALLSREKSWRKQDGIEERTFRTGLRKY